MTTSSSPLTCAALPESVPVGSAPSIPGRAAESFLCPKPIPNTPSAALPGADGPFHIDLRQGVDSAVVVWSHISNDAVGLASAGSTVEALSLFGQIRIATSLPGSASTVEDISAEVMVRAARPNAFIRRKVDPRMAQTDRLTTPVVDECSEVFRDLRSYFAETVRNPEREQRLLERLGNVTMAISMVDATWAVVLSGMNVNGLQSSYFRRKLREFERDFADKGTA